MGAVCGAERDDLAANLRWQRRAGGKLWGGFGAALFPAGPGGRDCGPVRRLEPATRSRDPQSDGTSDEEVRTQPLPLITLIALIYTDQETSIRTVLERKFSSKPERN